MDTSDPDIVFDENGWCNHCTGWFKRAALYALPAEERVRRLNAVVEEMKRRGRGKEYDCVIGVSYETFSPVVSITKSVVPRPLLVSTPVNLSVTFCPA